MITRRLLAAAALSAPLAAPALAQTPAFPSRTITLVVPWGPGGATDVIGRVIAQRFSQDLGVAVVVENRPGANGTIGTASVTRSRPDGYTMLFSTGSTYAMAPWLMDITYDNEKALAPIGRVGSVPMLILVQNSSPARNLRDFIEIAKRANPPMTYASSGTGSSTYLATELFLREAGIEMLEVAYRTGPATTASVIAGENQMLFMSSTNGLAVARQGQLRALAIAQAARNPLIPDVPTFAEEGIGNFEVTDDFAMFVPAGTPDPIVARLNQALNAALQAPEVRQRLEPLGVTTLGGPPEDFWPHFRSENTRWRTLIQAKNIRIQ